MFCKTDIQNLIAKNARREDIAASIFHAVAVQTVTTLAHGYDIGKPVLFCGGPLTFIPALRKAFMDYLSLREEDVILPERGALLPAMGAALSATECGVADCPSGFARRIEQASDAKSGSGGLLRPLFESREEYEEWRSRIARFGLKEAEWQSGRQDAFIGIDSGSTTTKIVVLNEKAEALYTFYKNNGGNPLATVAEGLRGLTLKCQAHGATLRVKGSCSTGYGEDLIRTAFQLHGGIVETIAHYIAARHLDREVSFILDIGGQDMKAIFIHEGIVDRIEINEACSSGCGSFIETFAKGLGYTVEEFAGAACRATAPCDLGTRCTVFMNSKVKQALREGAGIEDIAAGLAYSVVKNCLYKVLKLKDVSALGKHIVVQGGTMRNDAVARAIEVLTGTEVARCDCPELMGALGCALYAMEHPGREKDLSEIVEQSSYTTRPLNCKGCENQCLVACYQFANGKRYYSGNRCEKVFCNGNEAARKGANAYIYKYGLLFDRKARVEHPKLTIGIPRVLNMYEDYPFWHTLFTSCGMEVLLSEESNYADYERNAGMVMSDNICFPAKLVHSHIHDLQAKGADRIFMPFVVYERQGEGEQNSYNCPIVTGYSAVVKSVQGKGVPIDSPTISIKNRELLLKQCEAYLSPLGVDRKAIAAAFARAVEAQQAFLKELVEHNRKIFSEGRERGEMCVLLAGRPYHTDPLIQHRVAEMLAEMGINVLTDDVVRGQEVPLGDTYFLSQWAYPNRILKAAQWCAAQGDDTQFVQMTSFGCGPDAFLTDEVRDLLQRHGKALTLLKLDDINNVGSMKLRVRSLIESLRLAGERRKRGEYAEFRTTPVFDETYRDRKILIPFFEAYISPLIPSVLRVAGYDVENLPLSDERSCEWGLRFANNEVCYPATLIVGDIIKAFKSGAYSPGRCAVAITQTGGQCRASNYLPLIKKALIDAGYPDVPVISFTFGESLDNRQPGFKINWAKLLPVALRVILFSDCVNKFYYAAVVREKEKGQAKRLTESYLQKGRELIENHRSSELPHLVAAAARDFDKICETKELPRVGVVGEIFLKFNPFAQKNIMDWLIGQGIEVAPPILTDFFMQSFVNRETKLNSHLKKRELPDMLMKYAYRLVWAQVRKMNRMASEFRYFTPFNDIFAEAREAQEVITLNAQFGEGWLLPAEIISYVRQGIDSVISLQPFGCIANHIVAKGIEKRLKELYPSLNLLSLDFDSGVSDVNIKNRLLLFVNKLDGK